MIDVVIISDARNEHFRAITENAVQSALQDPVNVIVVESNPEVDYRNATTLHPKATFGYNKYLNLGARAGKRPYIAFCNNDLHFHPNWSFNIIKAMRDCQLSSASPICPETHKQYGFTPNTGVKMGNTVRKLLAGWCFVWTRELWTELPLDEDFTFWCADNATAEQLKQKPEVHGLVTTSVVDHMESMTLKTLDTKTYGLYTMGEVRKFNKKYHQNLFNAGI